MELESKSVNPTEALAKEKARFQILAEMVNELLATENPVDFLESVNFSLVTKIAEKTRKRDESEETRYCRVEDEVENRLEKRS